MEKQIVDKQPLIRLDILFIMRRIDEINWVEIRESSVSRILYLASVLYSFRYPKAASPFMIYNFTIDSSGPYDSSISSAIAYLIKDEFIVRTSGEDVYRLGQREIQLSGGLIEVISEREEWLKQVVNILGIYGENKIYDFIFRDPEYQTNLKSNTAQSIDISDHNETVKTLTAFKQVFEESLEENISDLPNQTYLELYFEYVFSRILKRLE